MATPARKVRVPNSRAAMKIRKRRRHSASSAIELVSPVRQQADHVAGLHRHCHCSGGQQRSEERRVGKECRSRRWEHYYKKKERVKVDCMIIEYDIVYR